MAWEPDFFIPLEPNDPRNFDRHDPGGDRIRMRLNKEGKRIADFVVQHETPVADPRRSHAVVLRSDWSQGPHFDSYDRFGRKRVVDLPTWLSPSDTIEYAVAYITTHWRDLAAAYNKGLS